MIVIVQGSFEQIGEIAFQQSVPSEYLQTAQQYASEGCYVLAMAHRSAAALIAISPATDYFDLQQVIMSTLRLVEFCLIIITARKMQHGAQTYACFAPETTVCIRTLTSCGLCVNCSS